MRTRKDENLRKPSSFIEAEKSTFPELAKNNVRFFSSARHNYIVRNITKQRKTKKIKDENLNWHSSLRKLPKKTFSSGVQ